VLQLSSHTQPRVVTATTRPTSQGETYDTYLMVIRDCTKALDTEQMVSEACTH